MKLSEIDTKISDAMAVIRGLPASDDPKGECPECGGTEFWLVEQGYVRYTTLVWEEDDDSRWHGITNGWDDMSEHGNAEHIVCSSCFEVFESPGIQDWD